LQDISQPKSEVTPPDGLLAVPLLRHQVTLQVQSFKFFNVVFFKKFFLQVIGAFSFPIPVYLFFKLKQMGMWI